MTRASVVYRRGEVVSVPFLFTDKAVTKNRPAIVVSSLAYNESRQEVMILGVTSNPGAPRFIGETAILDWRLCGLRAPSTATGIIQTVKRANILHSIGALSPRDLTSVISAMRVSLGL